MLSATQELELFSSRMDQVVRKNSTSIQLQILFKKNMKILCLFTLKLPENELNNQVIIKHQTVTPKL